MRLPEIWQVPHRDSPKSNADVTSALFSATDLMISVVKGIVSEAGSIACAMRTSAFVAMGITCRPPMIAATTQTIASVVETIASLDDTITPVVEAIAWKPEKAPLALR